jgi:hypothetical protein
VRLPSVLQVGPVATRRILDRAELRKSDEKSTTALHRKPSAPSLYLKDQFENADVATEGNKAVYEIRTDSGLEAGFLDEKDARMYSQRRIR